MLEGQTEIVADPATRIPEYRPVAVEIFETEHLIRHLQRWDIGTRYSQITRDAAATIDALAQLAEREDWSPPILGIDHTGVGRAVVDEFRDLEPEWPIVPITITGGLAAQPQIDQSPNDTPWTVPKKELVAPMLVSVQNGTFKIAEGLELADAANREMQAFRMKMKNPNTGHVSYESETEKDHDDIVIAMAIATWIAVEQIDKAA